MNHVLVDKTYVHWLFTHCIDFSRLCDICKNSWYKVKTQCAETPSGLIWDEGQGQVRLRSQSSSLQLRGHQVSVLNEPSQTCPLLGWTALLIGSVILISLMVC